MAKQIRYGAYADFQPEKMVTAELACVISGDPAVGDGMSLYICFSPGVVKRIATYADFEREIQNATQEIQDAFTEDVQAAIQAAVNAINNANDAITQANEAAEQALSAAADAEEAAEAALAAAGGDISEKTVTFESQDAEDPEEWTDVDVLSTGTKLSLLFQKVSSMFKNIRFLKKKTDELDLGVNELNTNITDGNKGIKVKDIYLGDNVYLYHDNGVFGVRVYIDGAYHFFHIRKDGLYFDGGKIT